VLYFGPSSEWDTAAPHGILRAAGHDLRQIDGEPMQYGKTPEFKNGDLLAGKF
jgi:3'(2'), 5'-bisphosphate nucleotidase